MSRTPLTGGPATRALAVLAVLPVLLVIACGNPPAYPPAPVPVPGQPAGTVVLPAGSDVAAVVTRVQDAITAGGGVVAAVVDNAADAGAAGSTIPPNTVIIGGPPAVQLPLVRADQRAALNLPERYLVRQSGDGGVTLTYNGPEFVAAVSGVSVPEARTPFGESVAAVVGQAVPAAGGRVATPLIGVDAAAVTAVFGSADVPVTVERMRRNVRGPGRVVATVDMAAGSAESGPPLRPTTLVLVSTPAAEAPLVAAAPSFGLELPMRFVVWSDDQQRTQIGYPDVATLAARHGIAADDPAVARMAADANRFAQLAAGIIE